MGREDMKQAQRVERSGGLVASIDALVTSDGAASHPFVLSRKLIDGRDATRNLADAVHFFGLLHGRHPGLADHALLRATERDQGDWLAQAAQAFVRERAYLSALSAAAGPMPSTAGQQQCEQTVLAQGRAIDMLGQSERSGCALGAALALALDWRAIRSVLDTAASRLEVSARPAALPDLHETIVLIERQEGKPAFERAMLFGAQQLLAQHRGLWDLLATRESARTHT